MGRFLLTFIIEDVRTHQMHSLYGCRTSLLDARHADTCPAQHEKLLSSRVDYILRVSIDPCAEIKKELHGGRLRSNIDPSAMTRNTQASLCAVGGDSVS